MLRVFKVHETAFNNWAAVRELSLIHRNKDIQYIYIYMYI